MKLPADFKPAEILEVPKGQETETIVKEAAWLYDYLKALRQQTRGRGRPKHVEGLTQAEVNAQAMGLLIHCYASEIRPPEALLRMFAEVLGLPFREDWPTSENEYAIDEWPLDEWPIDYGIGSDAFRDAVRCEARHDPDPRGKAPSVASINAVAKAVFPESVSPKTGASSRRNTIRRWRSWPYYRKAVKWERESIELAKQAAGTGRRPSDQ